MYPKCGCASECRLCNYLTNTKKGKKPVAALLHFAPGMTTEQVLQAAAVLKEIAPQVDIITYGENEQVGVKRSPLKPKESA